MRERNPEWSGTRLNMSTINAAYTVLQSDSSKVFMLDGGGYTITLPVAANLQEGWHAKFVVRPANPTGDIVITAGSAIVDLVMKDAGGDASNSTAGTAKLLLYFILNVLKETLLIYLLMVQLTMLKLYQELMMQLIIHNSNRTT